MVCRGRRQEGSHGEERPWKDKRLQMAVKAGESAGSVGARGYSRIALCEMTEGNPSVDKFESLGGFSEFCRLSTASDLSVPQLQRSQKLRHSVS